MNTDFISREGREGCEGKFYFAFLRGLRAALIFSVWF
jgi:hypothetical protein